MSAPTDPLALEDLRRVRFELAGAPALRDELVPAPEVELFVAGVLRLHHDPGLNPHSGRPAARLVRLEVGTPRLGAGHWWTGPSLSDDGPRARVVEWTWERRFEAEPEPDPVE